MRFTVDEMSKSLIADFLESVFGGLDADPAISGIRRSMTPELPDEPDAGQVAAWVELTEMTQDPEFREFMRALAQRFVDDRAGSDGLVQRDAVTLALDEARRAIEAGLDPTEALELSGGPRLLTTLEAAIDPRRERYLALLATVNGWTTGPGIDRKAMRWAVAARRA